MIGTVLKQRYRIDAILGRGGMADVYRAFDTRRNHAVAIKVLRDDLAEDWEFVRRFRAEADSLARLAHQNIVRFFGFEQDGRCAFIVMDCIQGDTLRGRIFEAQGPLSIDEVLRITRQVASALEYAHAEGIIHRDVKPANVMLKPDGAALLSDFGIARVADVATQTLGIPGTPAYMSPEQCQGGKLDGRTDVYSFGVMLFEMLTGRRPFLGQQAPNTVSGGTQERILWEHLHADPPSPRVYNTALTESVAQVVLRALAKKPDQRYPSALALAQALEAACVRPGPRPAPLAQPRTSYPPTRQRGAGGRPSEPQAPTVAGAIQGPAVKQAAPSGSDERSRSRLRVLAALAIIASAALFISATVLLIQRGRGDRIGQAYAPEPPTAAAVAITTVKATAAGPTAAAPAPTTTTPSPPPTATRLPTNAPTATRQPTATAAPAPTDTRAVPATSTRAPSATVVMTRASSPASPTPVVFAPAPVAIPAPVLREPEDGANVDGVVSFQWSWPGPPQDSNHGWEVRIWRDGQPDHYGAAAIVRGMSTMIDVWTAYGVQQGGPGRYYWTVALVQSEPYQRIGPEAPPRTLNIGSSGGDGGGGEPSKPPTPTSPPS